MSSIAEERAAAQARARAERADRRAAIDRHLAGSASTGAGLRRFVLVVTALHAVLTVATIVWLDTLSTITAWCSLALFATGLAMFAVALVRGAQRSRTAELTMTGWFFLVGSAPRRIQLELLGVVAVQTVVPIAAAAIHPFTRLAFGILVPVLGLAACALWSAEHGWFPPRRPTTRREVAP